MANEHASNVSFIRPVTAILNANSVTGSERAVLYGVLLGMSNQEIADELCVQEKTVKFHVTSIYKKLSVRNRANLIIKIAKLGHYGNRAEIIEVGSSLPKGSLN